MAQASRLLGAMSTAAPVETSAPRPSPWFRSARFDLLLILGVPILTWPLLTAARVAWGPELLAQLILLTATGHYMATFVRAYGDRELFARFRVRFLVAPVVLLTTCVGLYVAGYGAHLLLMVAGWAFWHWLAQAFGFARIYDIKVGSYARLTAWLDKALVITGFVAAVTLNDGAVATFAKVFLAAGIPLPSAATMNTIRTVVKIACIVVGGAYATNLIVTIAAGRPWSWQKQFMHVTTIGYYWFAFTWLPNVLIAHVLYEFFHDVQYFAITWLTCRSRVQRPGTTAWLRRMFSPGVASTVLFVGLMVAFGAVDAFGRHSLLDGTVGQQVWIGVFLAVALLHYYYDGFIWKARERSVGGDLGISDGLRAAVVPSMRHGALWALFFVPLIASIALSNDSPLTPRQRAEALVSVAPDDFYSRQSLGMELTRARELPEALDNYRRAVELNPDFAPSRINYGAALEIAGDEDAAIEQYLACLECPDQNGSHGAASTNAGLLLLMRGDRAAATAHFERARALGAQHPVERAVAMGNGIAERERERRKRYYEAALTMQKDNLDARLNLGLVLMELHRFAEAATHLAAFASKAPNYAPALYALADARFETGDADEARRLFTRAAQLQPDNPSAAALRSKFGVR